jgi:DNA-binding transcriptional LysR family regulator
MGIPRSRDLAVKRVSSESSVADMYERILDKGIAIDAWMRLSLAGRDLAQINMRVVVASTNTYLTRASALAVTEITSPPLLVEPHPTGNPRQIRRKPPGKGSRVA